MSRPRIVLPEEIGRPPDTRREVVVGHRTDGGEARPTILRWFETWATGGRERDRR